MTTFQTNLLTHVSASPGIPDSGLRVLLFGDHKEQWRFNSETVRVNSTAHLLETRGKLSRQFRQDGLIGNYPVMGPNKYFCLKCCQWVERVPSPTDATSNP